MKKGYTAMGFLILYGILTLISPMTVQSEPTARASESTANPPALSPDLEDVISGFNDNNDTFVYEQSDDDASATKAWDISGKFTLAAVYNISHEAPAPGQTDFRGLSRLRPELCLNLEVDLADTWYCKIGGRGFHDFAYAIQGRNDFTDQVLDEYENEIELTETYIEGAITPSLNLKIGRQIVVWGNTENFRVTDILNPVDNRDPGMVDIEDLRLPTGMARLTYYNRSCNLSFIAVPEIRFDKQPVMGNDFYPFDRPLPPEDKPADSLKNIETAMALKGIFHGWDMTLYGAFFFNDESHFETIGSRETVVGQTPLPDGDMAPVIALVPIYRRRHARLSMTGFSVNVARGSWLFKSEAAFTGGLKFNTTDDEKCRLKGLVGFEYSGFTDTLVVLELVQTHLFDYQDRMGDAPDYADENRFEAAFRISRNLYHDRLELMLLAIAMGNKARDGAFERLTAEYELTDALTIKAGGVFYQDGESIMYDNIHDNNRFFVNLEYTF
jgi:hypothetical protein